MSSSRLLRAATLAGVALLLAGCPAGDPDVVVDEPGQEEPETGADEPEEDQPEAPDDGTDEEQVRLAILLPCAVNDLTWCQMAYEGVTRLEEEGLIELGYSDNAPWDMGGASRMLSGYAEEDYDVVIGHSFSYGEPIMSIHDDYPDTLFAWQGGLGEEGTAENIADYFMPIYEPAYLAGILAGHLTESNILGGGAGFDIPACRAQLEAFRLGAEEVNPDVEQLMTFIGDWADVAGAKEAAVAQAERGADVFIVCGDGPSRGMIEAAREQDFSIFSYVGDQSSLAPEHIVGSQVWNLYAPFREMVDDVREGTSRPGQVYEVNMSRGGFDLVLNPDYAREIPPEAMELFEERRQEIIDDEFEVPFIPVVED